MSLEFQMIWNIWDMSAVFLAVTFYRLALRTDAHTNIADFFENQDIYIYIYTVTTPIFVF